MHAASTVPPFFTHWCERLRGLNTHERLAVCCFMSELTNGERIAALIDQIAGETMACSRCASRQFGRHGFAYGLQRYRRRACAKTFDAFNGLTEQMSKQASDKNAWCMSARRSCPNAQSAITV